jgi:hypothetical protein
LIRNHLLFRGGHLASAGQVVVASALGTGNVTITGQSTTTDR